MSGFSRVSGVRAGLVGLLCAITLVASVPLLAAVRPPKLQYTTVVLPNGLRVILSEDHSTPIVHVSLWYHVGSKNERPGRTGFAHLFEHMMFKGSKNVRPEEHMSLIAQVGGQANAYTTEDETVFWATIPSQYLPTALWLEADRMATLRIDAENFKTEREVVKEERRMRIDNQPYGRLNEIIYDQAFTTHPYKHPTIGSMADLDAAAVLAVVIPVKQHRAERCDEPVRDVARTGKIVIFFLGQRGAERRAARAHHVHRMRSGRNCFEH